jgi:hypothetical protein
VAPHPALQKEPSLDSIPVPVGNTERVIAVRGWRGAIRQENEAADKPAQTVSEKTDKASARPPAVELATVDDQKVT